MKRFIGIILAVAVAACFVPEDKGKNRAQRRGSAAAKEKKTQRKLASLPYVNWVPVKPKDRRRRGVTRHDPGRAWRGLTLYNSMPRARAQLIDMRGEVKHSWSSDEGQPTPADNSSGLAPTCSGRLKRSSREPLLRRPRPAPGLNVNSKNCGTSFAGRPQTASPRK